MFTAVAALQLIEAGRLACDFPNCLASFFPRYLALAGYFRLEDCEAVSNSRQALYIERAAVFLRILSSMRHSSQLRLVVLRRRAAVDLSVSGNVADWIPKETLPGARDNWQLSIDADSS